ncbi:MAG: MSHA biogenesis protein MshE, partial [Elusimicrobiota bacterium]
MGERGLSINIPRRLGEMLVSSGLITAAQLNEALELQRSSGGKLGQLLIHKKFMEERRLLEFLSKQFGIEFIDLR